MSGAGKKARWVACIRQNVMRDGKIVRVEKEEDIPEAEFFPQRDEVWVKQGFVRLAFKPAKPKRIRRTNEQIAADKAAAEAEAKAEVDAAKEPHDEDNF